MLIFQALTNLSDEQVEDQVRDRLSCTRFLRLGIEDSIPDATLGAKAPPALIWVCF
jgi:IS5 family transposase